MTNLEKIAATLRIHMPAQSAQRLARQILFEQGYTEAMMVSDHLDYRTHHIALREAAKAAADGSCDDADTLYFTHLVNTLDRIEAPGAAL